MAAVQSIFSDFPKAAIGSDGVSVRLTGRYRRKHKTGTITFLVGLFFSFALVAALPQGSDIAVWGALFLAFAAAYWLDRTLTDGRINIVYRDEAVQVGRKSYPRVIPIEYRVQNHRQTLKARYHKSYNRVLEVVMQYGEKQVQLAEIDLAEQEKAQALVLRLSILEHDLAGFIAATKGTKTASMGFGHVPEIN